MQNINPLPTRFRCYDPPDGSHLSVQELPFCSVPGPGAVRREVVAQVPVAQEVVRMGHQWVSSLQKSKCCHEANSLDCERYAGTFWTEIRG